MSLIFVAQLSSAHMLFYGRDCLLDRHKDLCCSDNEEVVLNWVWFTRNAQYSPYYVVILSGHTDIWVLNRGRPWMNRKERKLSWKSWWKWNSIRIRRSICKISWLYKLFRHGIDDTLEKPAQLSRSHRFVDPWFRSLCRWCLWSEGRPLELLWFPVPSWFRTRILYKWFEWLCLLHFRPERITSFLSISSDTERLLSYRNSGWVYSRKEFKIWLERIRGGCADPNIADDDKWTECEWKWNSLPYNNLFRQDSHYCLGNHTVRVFSAF